MTAIYYPDDEATAPSGWFTLEARSPDNGTIARQDGKFPSPDDFGFKYREHQRGFRSRLRDNRADSILWERWQPKGENSPHQLLVSDAGWSIVRTHGFEPEVIAFEPGGAESIRVKIMDADADDPRPGVPWHPDTLRSTTAGNFWTGDSWPYFFEYQSHPWFGWRTAWGQRLVLDLSRSRVVTTAEQCAESNLAAALDAAEQIGARNLLAALAPVMDEVRALLHEDADRNTNSPLLAQIRRVHPAIQLVGVHHLRDCLAWLREWEAIDHGSSETGSHALWRGDVVTQYFRPIVHHALRLLDEEPVGYPTYHFIDRHRNRLPSAEQLENRHARLAQLDPGLAAPDVLQLLGAPDFVQQQSHPVGKMYRWTERWDYDFRLASGWVTTRITWEEEKKTGRITTIDEVPAEWLQNDDRIRKMLF